MIYCLFQFPTTDLHDIFGLLTLETKYKKYVMSRLKKIQLYEADLIFRLPTTKEHLKHRVLTLQRKSMYRMATKTKA